MGRKDVHENSGIRRSVIDIGGRTAYDAASHSPGFGPEFDAQEAWLMSLTDSLQHDRHVVVAVDLVQRTVRIKTAADACTDLSCSEQTLVVADDAGGRADLTALNAGDIVKLEGPSGRPRRIIVLRRVWDELSSPEW